MERKVSSHARVYTESWGGLLLPWREKSMEGPFCRNKLSGIRERESALPISFSFGKPFSLKKKGLFSSIIGTQILWNAF